MSSDLVWRITRSNSSFLVKRNGAQFSREAGNLRNLHSFKYSAAANKTVDITAAANGVQVTLARAKVGANKPSTHTVSTVVSGSTRAAAKSVKNLVSTYRGDLLSAALARVSRINESKKAPKAIKAKKVRGAVAKKQL
ncbi:ribosomal L28e/Mak16 [Entophlyctis helioformis]|nr:ribosomal L28e/Mak16 [Entophlyctis helioformis]